MFNEVLKIKPVLDESTTKSMEASLTSRFARVASRFGAGLKNVVKGSVLGISLGLLNKLLNPIEALDDKIKGLLSKGTDIKDLAERFGTSGGNLQQAEDVAQSLKLSPDAFKEILLKFTDTVEKAREELANPLTQKSEATLVVGQFSKNKDMLENFKNFTAFLRQTGQGKGTDQPLSARASRIFADAEANKTGVSEEQRQALIKSGELRRRSAEETRADFEKLGFGSQQYGAGRRLIDTNLDAAAKKINEPSVAALNEKIEKLSGLDSQKAVLEVQNRTRDFMEASTKINSDMVAAMVKAEARQEAEATKRLDAYDNLKNGADAIADIQQGFEGLLDIVSEGLGLLKGVTKFIPQIAGSPLLKGIMKTLSKRE